MERTTIGAVAPARVTRLLNLLSAVAGMFGKRGSFPLFLIVNLAAAYAPGLLWLPSLPGQGASPWLVPLSPLLLVMFSLNTENSLACCVVLMILLLSIGSLSAVFSRFRRAWIVVPAVLFVLSLMQGLIVTEIVQGIDAIGHS
jgi:hypothetical protein